MKLVREIAVEYTRPIHERSVLIAILDPMARQHTAMKHGTITTVPELKKMVLEFVNNVGPGDPMQLGSIGGQGGRYVSAEELEELPEG